MKYAEYNEKINYPEGSIASFNGVNKAYIKNPRNSFKMEWVVLPSLNDSKELTLDEKPSLMRMLADFTKTYNQNPDEVAQRFMIEQYKVEFEYWSMRNK